MSLDCADFVFLDPLLPGATFILGGQGRPAGQTSDVLLRGEVTWRTGPDLPMDMYIGGCAVKISSSQFLAIIDINIWEFDTKIAGSDGIGSEGWRPAGTWPDLRTRRMSPSCAATAGLVVVAGGWSALPKSTDIIDLSSRTVTPGPEMLEVRGFFQLAALPAPGGAGGRVLAFGGIVAYGRGIDGNTVETVEEWQPGAATTWRERHLAGAGGAWRTVARLQGAPWSSGGRVGLGAVALPKELVCPP